MDTTFIFRGILLGFSIAAPVGPIGVLCIRRTLADGRATGLVSGLGAATADLVYGAVSAFGLTAVSGLLVGQAFWFRLVGGLFLIYLGVRTGLSAPANRAAPARPERADHARADHARAALVSAYFSTFLLTLTNPMTILSFAAVFAGVGLGAVSGRAASQGPQNAGLLVAGVFAGSAAWWLLLSTGVGVLRQKITPAVLAWVNRAAGVILVIFGVVALVSAAGVGP